MDNNELEEKLIGNALNYQKTLAKILGPLNEMNPIANVIEEQQKLAHGISESCRKATLSAKNLSFPKITVTYPDKVNEVPMIENRELYLAKDSERQINELKDEIISLKAEIKTDREERKMKGFIEYPEMFMEHPELAKFLLERIRSVEAEEVCVKKNHTGSNEKTTQRERNKRRCYELFDEMMERAPKMSQAEIKKIIATKMHITSKTVNEYLRERP
ncbi:MAG: hypothetical protein IK102_03075 [Treponema sp.]|nr:hypothetical protein [Treponema sp.]